MNIFLIGFVFAVLWSPIAEAAVNIEEAIAKIQVISAEINMNDAACREEQNIEEKLIASRYDKLIDEIKQQQKGSKGKPLVRDEFETPEEFKQRGNSYQMRVPQLIQQKNDEIYEFRKVKGYECRKKTALLRNELGRTTRQKFLVDPKNLKIEIGKYNLQNESFPFSLEGKNEKLVKISALKGVIHLPREEAKEWKQHWLQGLVQPEISITPEGEISTAKLFDNSDDKLFLRFDGGSFMTERAREQALLQVTQGKNSELITTNIGYTGSVVESMNSGGYTYMLINTGKKMVWAAAPEFYVQLGDRISLPNNAIPMAMYESKSLQRSFDLMHFVDSAYIHPKDGSNFSNELENKDMEHIKKADKTVAEIFLEKASLAGKFICVRGKAVNYSPEIMGYNWIHLQDGTGAAGSSDLTVRTKEVASQGNILLICGTVEYDLSFGYGYTYTALIEDAFIDVDEFTSAPSLPVIERLAP